MLFRKVVFTGVLNFGNKTYINSGSIGIAINDAGNAQCLILEDFVEGGLVKWKATPIKVPYDNMQVVEDIYKSGLLDYGKWFVNHNIHTLTTGEDLIVEFNILVHKLSEETGVPHVWPHIEEKFYEQATRALKIPDYRRK